MESETLVAIFKTHSDAEQAIRDLQRDGFDMAKLSIVSKDYQTDEHVVGFYNTGDRMKYWGQFGAFWGGLWGLLFGAAFLFVPALGPVVVAGPLVASIIAGLEGAIAVGGLSAVGAALLSIGIPKDSVVRYEAALNASQFLLIAHGGADEVTKAREILQTSSPAEVNIHPSALVEPAVVG
jgi:hypothetical protein